MTTKRTRAARGKPAYAGPRDFAINELSRKDFELSPVWYLTLNYPYVKWCWGDPMKWVNGASETWPEIEVIAMAELPPKAVTK